MASCQTCTNYPDFELRAKRTLRGLSVCVHCALVQMHHSQSPRFGRRQSTSRGLYGSSSGWCSSFWNLNLKNEFENLEQHSTYIVDASERQLVERLSISIRHPGRDHGLIAARQIRAGKFRQRLGTPYNSRLISIDFTAR